jgi:hypothetical protein
MMLAGAEVPAWVEEFLAAIRRGVAEGAMDAFDGRFAENATYFLAPQLPPLRGRDAIFTHLAKQIAGQRDMQGMTEVMGFSGMTALVRWRATYVLRADASVQHYDALILYDFAAPGVCARRRSWAVQWAGAPLP